MTRDSTPTVYATRRLCAINRVRSRVPVGESTMAASTRTCLTRDRLKCAFEGHAVVIGAALSRSNRPEGGRPRLSADVRG